MAVFLGVLIGVVVGAAAGAAPWFLAPKIRRRLRRTENVQEEEIRKMVDASAETGSIDKDEIEMINNVFAFDDRTVWEISTHRREMTSLSIDADMEEVVRTVTETAYSRIPVYEGSIDNIIGILHSKDMMKHVLNSGLENIKIRDILRKPYFVPQSKKTDELFREMQKKKVHMAIILDEYGGTAGFVTMEDLIESVMGNILDEYDDEEEPDIVALDETTFKISGGAPLESVAEFFGAEMPVGEFNTLSGFIIGELGHIPSEDESPEIVWGGLVFKVKEIDERRIVSAVVSRAESSVSENEGVDVK